MTELSPVTTEASGADWTLRYTTHLGYEPPIFRPQFVGTLGTEVAGDLAAHVEYAASLGMAGALYPWALSRPAEERVKVARALEATGLAASCVVCVPFASLTTPVWTDRTPSVRAELASYVRQAVEAARELGSGVLAAIPITETELHTDADREAAMDATAANLQAMCAIASDHGLTIAVEPMVVLPNSLLNSTAAAVGLLERVGSDAAGVIYDTGHVAMMGEDLLESLDAVYPHLTLAQFADQPGRVEPGAGELQLVQVAEQLVRRGYGGLVDLEHGWRTPDSAGDSGRPGTRPGRGPGCVRRS